MSMETWITYGYGINTSDYEDKITLDSINAVLQKAPKFESRLRQMFIDDLDIENPTVDDFLEADDDFGTKSAYLLAEIIEETEDLSLTVCTDEYGDAYLLFEPTYPWTGSAQAYAGYSKEKIANIINKYAEILYGEKVDVDFQEAHNYG